MDRTAAAGFEATLEVPIRTSASCCAIHSQASQERIIRINAEATGASLGKPLASLFGR